MALIEDPPEIEKRLKRPHLRDPANPARPRPSNSAGRIPADLPELRSLTGVTSRCEKSTKNKQDYIISWLTGPVIRV